MRLVGDSQWLSLGLGVLPWSHIEALTGDEDSDKTQKGENRPHEDGGRGGTMWPHTKGHGSPQEPS